VALHLFKEDGTGIKIPAVHLVDGVTDQDIDEQLKALNRNVMPKILSLLSEIPAGEVFDMFEDLSEESGDTIKVVVMVSRIGLEDFPEGMDWPEIDSEADFEELLKSLGLI